jgi:dynein-related subfamily AAA family protein
MASNGDAGASWDHCGGSPRRALQGTPERVPLQRPITRGAHGAAGGQASGRAARCGPGAAPLTKQKDEFQGYTAEAVKYLRSLPEHTSDPAWHRENKARFQKYVRDPTEALIRMIGARYLTSLDAEVAVPNRPMSLLKKNDFGGDGYHAHFWFAFYDPEASSKTESVQLFLVLEGGGDYCRYGVGVGHFGRRYHDQLIAALRAAPEAAASFLEALPDGFEVRLRYQDRERVIRPLDLAGILRGGSTDDVLDEAGLESLNIQRRLEPLDRLVVRGAALASDVGTTFVALWPLFCAARTGKFEGARSPVDVTDRGGENADEDAPDSLAELSTITSAPWTLLQEIEEALLARGQAVLLGPPGTSKTYLAEQFARYFVRYQPGTRPQGQFRVIYMHASWAYEDFFEGIRPKVGGIGLEFVPHQGAFLAWVDDVVKEGPPGARYVLVLDEINRCDTAAVLGELLQLMEYRGKRTQLLSGRAFTLPRRLYLLGTMNSADRSIGRLDLALRRRFLFIDLLPDYDILQTG